MQKKTCLRVVGILSRQGIVAIGAFAIATMLFIAGSGEALAQSARDYPGYNHIEVFNCNTNRRTVYLWTRDVTQDAQAPFVEKGSLPAQFSDGKCPPLPDSPSRPLIIPLTDGHQYELVAVDPENLQCEGKKNPNDPPCGRTKSVCSCWRTKVGPFRGDKDGKSLPIIVD